LKLASAQYIRARVRIHNCAIDSFKCDKLAKRTNVCMTLRCADSVEAGLYFETALDNPAFKSTVVRDFFERAGISLEDARLHHRMNSNPEPFFHWLDGRLPDNRQACDWFQIGFLSFAIVSIAIRRDAPLATVLAGFRPLLERAGVSIEWRNRIQASFQRIADESPYEQKRDYFGSLSEELREVASMTEDKRLRSGGINISGGVFVGTQVGGIANKLDAYVEELKLDQSGSPAESDLKKTLASLRRAIEDDQVLTKGQKTAAATDLALATEELSDPASNDAKAFYWKRLTEVIQASAALTTIASAAAKLMGLG
jgi:hypothetical protein